jgi:hypothetical protein
MAEEQHVHVAPIGPQGPTQSQLSPHRGTLILVLGILGIVCCFICGIIAWVMGSGDLREMAAGRMDPSGQGITQAGKICGMVGVILWIIGLVIQVLFMFVLGGGLFSLSPSVRTM